MLNHFPFRYGMLTDVVKPRRAITFIITLSKNVGSGHLHVMPSVIQNSIMMIWIFVKSIEISQFSHGELNNMILLVGNAPHATDPGQIGVVKSDANLNSGTG